MWPIMSVFNGAPAVTAVTTEFNTVTGLAAFTVDLAHGA
jgi:hypothetical protein